MTRLSEPSKATVRRLAFRLLVIVALAVVWPGPSVARATAMFCLLLAVGCIAGAWALGEPVRRGGLNRWHEAAVLVIVACVVLLVL